MKYVENVMELITDGITVANLRRTDIQKVSTYDYTQYKHEPNNWEEKTEETEGLIHFGETKKESNYQYPEMWGKYDSNWTYGYNVGKQTGSDKECEIWERENGYETVNGEQVESGSTEFKQSMYYHDYKGKENEFINKEYYNLLFKNEEGTSDMGKIYWLAGRGVDLNVYNNVGFGLQSVRVSEGCRVFGYWLFNQSGSSSEAHCGLRPVISINLISSGYSLEKVVGEDNKVSFKLVEDNN